MKKLYQIIALLMTVVILVAGADYLLARNDSNYKYRQFFDEKCSFDVLFFGSSHVRNAISPMQLWEQYGITSYNFGNDNSLLPQTYWAMVEATRYHKPKVIVLDVAFIHWDDKTQGAGLVHEAFDCFKLDKTKYELARDLFDDNASRMEILFPFSIYHNRWSEFSKIELMQKLSGETNWNKGCDLVQGVCDMSDYDIIPQDDYAEIVSTGTIYLKKIMDFCKENEIELVLVNIPSDTTDENQRCVNYIPVMTGKDKVPFLNLPYMDLVDIDTDFYNISHVNYSGATKITSYLGDYLVSNYGLTDKRGGPEY